MIEDSSIPDQITDYKGIKWKKDVDKCRYSYQVYDDKDPLDFTLIGIQKGDWLMLDDDLDISYMMKGINSAEVFKSKNLNTNKIMGISISAIGLSLI